MLLPGPMWAWGTWVPHPVSQPPLSADLRGEGAAGEPGRGDLRATHLRGVPGAAQQAAPPLPLLAAAQVPPQTPMDPQGLPATRRALLSLRPRSFPSRFVIGRSRGEAVAERRKEELNGYIWHLIHAAPEVAEVWSWGGSRRGRGGVFCLPRVGDGAGDAGEVGRCSGASAPCKASVPNSGGTWSPLSPLTSPPRPAVRPHLHLLPPPAPGREGGWHQPDPEAGR